MTDLRKYIAKASSGQLFSPCAHILSIWTPVNMTRVELHASKKSANLQRQEEASATQKSGMSESDRDAAQRLQRSKDEDNHVQGLYGRVL